MGGDTGGLDGSSGVALPASFYTVTLPLIESLAELKVTLYLHWLLSRAGAPRSVSLADLEADRLLLRALKPAPGPRPVQETLREGLEMAITRGSLLHVSLEEADDPRRRWYLLHTQENRAILDKLAAGEITPGQALDQEVGAVTVARVYRSNVFSLYEQGIGVLTATVADGLRDAEQTYPREWIEEAIRLAVDYNKRSWAYVAGILKRWETEGKSVGTDRQHSEAALDPEKYTSGRYGHLVES